MFYKLTDTTSKLGYFILSTLSKFGVIKKKKEEKVNYQA